MDFGVCIDVVSELEKGNLADKLTKIKKTGFNFIETPIVSLKKLDNNSLENIKKECVENGLKISRTNVLFPSEIKIVSDNADKNIIENYLRNVLPKARRLGVEIAVFGSGSSRRHPDNMSYNDAINRFVEHAKFIVAIAEEYNIKIALEHLNPSEDNLLTTVKKAVDAIEKIDKKNCGLLFDYFHVNTKTDDIQNLLHTSDILFHVHLALQNSRLYPREENHDELKPFRDILFEASYNGTISIEGNLHNNLNYEENLMGSYKVLKALFN